MKRSTSKPCIVSKAQAAQDVVPFVSQPEHALALLDVLAQAQWSIEDLQHQHAQVRARSAALPQRAGCLQERSQPPAC
jgi:hypothetical protein